MNDTIMRIHYFLHNGKRYEKIADEVAKGLTEDGIQYILKNAEHGDYHFGLGLYIRNKYKVHDTESGDIASRVIYKVLTEHNRALEGVECRQCGKSYAFIYTDTLHWEEQPNRDNRRQVYYIDNYLCEDCIKKRGESIFKQGVKTYFNLMKWKERETAALYEHMKSLMCDVLEKYLCGMTREDLLRLGVKVKKKIVNYADNPSMTSNDYINCFAQNMSWEAKNKVKEALSDHQWEYGDFDRRLRLCDALAKLERDGPLVYPTHFGLQSIILCQDFSVIEEFYKPPDEMRRIINTEEVCYLPTEELFEKAVSEIIDIRSNFFYKRFKFHWQAIRAR